jgi:hypothetical protein
MVDFKLNRLLIVATRGCLAVVHVGWTLSAQKELIWLLGRFWNERQMRLTYIDLRALNHRLKICQKALHLFCLEDACFPRLGGR